MDPYHPTELLPALALGCLDADESPQVKAHLAGCSACQAELRTLQETTARLMAAVPPVAPPDAIKSRLLERVRRPQTYPWFARLLDRWPRLVPAAAVAAMMLVVVLGAANLLLLQRDQTAGNRLERLQLVRLQGTTTMPAASGVLLVDPDRRTGVLVVESLQVLDRSLQYQLWLIKDGRRTSGGTFSVSSRGSARHLVAASQALAGFDAFGVTIEPFGGSAGPTGAKVLGGKMVL